MKRIYFTILSAAAALAFAACDKDTTETPDIQPAGGETITVAASLAETTKTTFNDSEGIRWDAGDILKANAYRPAGEKNEWCWDRNSSAVEIAGTTGSFTFKDIQYDEKDESLWFMHGTEGGNVQNGLMFKYHDGSFVQAQSAAGTMNAAYLFLLSDPTTWNSITEVQDGGVGTVGENAVKLHIFGSVIRFIPYSGDETFRTEKIESIKLESDNSNVTGRSIYKPYTKTFDADNVLSQIAGKEITVKLAEAFSLEGADARDKGAGIYMAMPPIATIEGYRYIVNTDAAIYTFDGSDKTLTLTDGTVKNVFLDLAKCTHRVGYDEIKGELHYVGDLGAADNKTFDHQAHPEFDGGYWYAQIKGGEYADWTTREARDYPEFYDNVQFSVIDKTTGAPADWLKVYYKANSTHWGLDIAENTSSETRTATVTATFSDVNGYVVTPECLTKTITVTQHGVVKIIPSIEYDGATEISKEGASVTATLSLTVNGTVLSDSEANSYMSELTISAQNANVKRDGVKLNIDIAPNMHTAVKDIVISAVSPDGNAELHLMQAAGDSDAVSIFSYTFGDWQRATSTRYFDWNVTGHDTTEWMAVIFNIQKDGVAPDSLTPEDEANLVKQILGMSDETYANTFLTFKVEYSKGETKILFGAEVNETGAERVEEGYVWASDYSYCITRFRITQKAQ